MANLVTRNHGGHNSSLKQILPVLYEMLTLQLIIESDLLHQQQDRCFKTKDLTPSSCNSSFNIKRKGTFFIVSCDGVFRKYLKLKPVLFYVSWKAVIMKNCN